MRKVFNFNAGPAMLPEEVLKKAQEEMLDWHDTGMSMLELGHRGKEFAIVAEKSEADLRELMNIPKNYKVLFLSGGASTQFAMVPLNLMAENHQADYVNTGTWSKKALDEAKRYGEVNIAAHLIKHEGLSYIPAQHEWNINPKAAYLHFTPNETIDGVQFDWVPKIENVPIVADMTSMILSKPINVSDYGIIYAGAQKNLGPAGIHVVIIREDLIKEPFPRTPTLYTYKVQAENNSFYNTPPTYNWYLVGLTLAWAKHQGGINSIYEKNLKKSQKLYSIIDHYPEFYQCRVHPSCRSMMNVMFYLKDDSLTSIFLEEAQKLHLKNLRGHRVSGGVRASIYNAMPDEGVAELAEFMLKFVEKYG